MSDFDEYPLSRGGDGHDPDADGDTPKEECGIFGVYAPGEDVARLTFFGLFALQHRGQESAGIAVSDGRGIRMHKDMGLVTQVFDEGVLAGLKGHVAIGHTRYSTTGSSVLRNAQPLQCCLASGGDVAVAHNGNLINAEELRAELEAEGFDFATSNDSEVIARAIAAQTDAATLADAVRGAMRRIRGAYSLAIMADDQLIGARDPYGVRPLCLGRLGTDRWVLASESCALNTIDAVFVRELAPGEIVVIDRNGVKSVPGLPTERHALCMLEMIYFARPDSEMWGESLHFARQRMGEELAREHPAPDADLVIPVPDSGTPAALGFARASGIPYAEGLIKNRYIQRTFIQPDQRMRELGVRMKLTPIKEALKGKRVVMVDDSIVRGTTTGKVVRLLLDAGAREVHVRITAPPVRWPCFYGIDMATQDQLVAATHEIEEIRRLIGATSLGYISEAGLGRALAVPNDNFCMACFTGSYPIDLPEHIKMSKFALELPVAAGAASGRVPVALGTPAAAVAAKGSIKSADIAPIPRRNGHTGASGANGAALPERDRLPDDGLGDGIDDAKPGG